MALRVLRFFFQGGHVSSLYRCAINVTGCNNQTMAYAIKKAIQDFWCFDEPSIYQSGTDSYWVDADGEGNLGGDTKEFAKQLAINVWKANQGACEVSIDTIYMEDLPTESFVFDESKYVEIMAKA